MFILMPSQNIVDDGTLATHCRPRVNRSKGLCPWWCSPMIWQSWKDSRRLKQPVTTRRVIFRYFRRYLDGFPVITDHGLEIITAPLWLSPRQRAEIFCGRSPWSRFKQALGLDITDRNRSGFRTACRRCWRCCWIYIKRALIPRCCGWPPATQPFDVDLLKVGDKLVDQLEAVKTWYFF